MCWLQTTDATSACWKTISQDVSCGCYVRRPESQGTSKIAILHIHLYYVTCRVTIITVLKQRKLEQY